MISITVPREIRKVADRYKDLSGTPYGTLCALFLGHLFGCKTLSDIARSIAWVGSVSSLSRGIKSFDSNRAMRRLQASILRRLKGQINSEDYCYAIDDTSNSKYGKTMYRVSNWGHKGGAITRGQRVMVIALVDRRRGIAIPLAFKLCTKKNDPEYQSGHEIAHELCRNIRSAGFPALTVVMDSWFDSAALIDSLWSDGFTFVVHAKSMRKVKNNAFPNTPRTTWCGLFRRGMRFSIRLVSPENGTARRRTKYCAQSRAFLKGLDRALKAVAVYNKQRDAKPFAVYLTNDFTLSVSEVWAISRSRWHIEEMFRTLKQKLAFGRLPCNGESGAHLTFTIPFILLTIFTLEPDLWDIGKEKTISGRISRFRERSLNNSISCLLKEPSRAAVKILQARRSLERLNRKPVNSIADEISA